MYNTARDVGGAIYAANTMFLGDCSIYYNTASRGGGGIYFACDGLIKLGGYIQITANTSNIGSDNVYIAGVGKLSDCGMESNSCVGVLAPVAKMTSGFTLTDLAVNVRENNLGCFYSDDSTLTATLSGQIIEKYFSASAFSSMNGYVIVSVCILFGVTFAAVTVIAVKNKKRGVKNHEE